MLFPPKPLSSVTFSPEELKALEKLAWQLEKARLGEYVSMMNDTKGLLRKNFLAER